MEQKDQPKKGRSEEKPVFCPYVTGITEDYGQNSIGVGHCSNNGFKRPGEQCELMPAVMETRYGGKALVYRGECGSYFDEHFRLMDNTVLKIEPKPLKR
ncbi:MAG: hypothetical protein QXU82_01605 [Candidatus Aenigmatarchaeota archaeon]